MGRLKQKKMWFLFNSTAWNALCKPHGDDIHAMTECGTNYLDYMWRVSTRTVLPQ